MSRWKTKIRYGYTTNGEFINTLTTDTYEGPFFEQYQRIQIIKTHSSLDI